MSPSCHGPSKVAGVSPPADSNSADSTNNEIFAEPSDNSEILSPPIEHDNKPGLAVVETDKLVTEKLEMFRLVFSMLSVPKMQSTVPLKSTSPKLDNCRFHDTSSPATTVDEFWFNERVMYGSGGG